MKISGNAMDLIEINLMFAKLDLTLGRNEPGAATRAFGHLQEALRHIQDMADPQTDTPPSGESERSAG